MKKTVFFLVFALFFLIAFPISATSSLYDEENFEVTVPKEIEEYLPRDFLEAGVDDLYRTLDFNFFSEVGVKLIAAAVPKATKDFAKMLGLLLVAACLGALKESFSSSALKSVLSLVNMLCVAGAVFTVTETAFSLAETFISSLSAFLSVLLPVMTALMIAGGQVTTAAVMTSVVSTALSVLETITAGTLFPLVRICLCLSAVSSVFGTVGIGNLVPMLRRIVSYVFGFVTLCLSAVLTFQSIITRSADSLAMRGIKFAVGSFVPFVGGAVNEALSTVMGGVGLIRASTGIVGAVSVCILAALPIIQILLQKMFLELLVICASLLRLDGEGKLIAEMASFFGYMAAIMAISAVFFILALSMMAKLGMG